jgi:hypothetical protein
VTASAARRRRNTIVGLVATVMAVVAALALAAVGAATLRDSRAGHNASADTLPELGLPVTPTALVGVVDDAGALTSLVVLVLAPNGAGGSIVVLPATGDSSLGLGDDRFPLDETFAAEGADAFAVAAEALAGISFDVIEVVDAERLADIVTPLGELTVDLPADVVDDADPARPLFTAGPTTLTPDDVAAVLTARPPEPPGATLDPVRLATWTALAERVGAGIGSALPVAPDVAVPTPRGLDPFLDRLFAGPVAARGVLTTAPEADANPRGVDVVVPDRAELLLVFGQIAPARVSAPNPSLTFRIETSFTEADLEGLEINAADVAYDAIARLLYVQANVVSVVTRSGEVPDITQAFVAERSRTDIVADNYPLVFGELEVHPATERIAGIDVVVVLGRSYLEQYRSVAPTDISLPAAATVEPPEGTG